MFKENMYIIGEGMDFILEISKQYWYISIPLIILFMWIWQYYFPRPNPII